MAALLIASLVVIVYALFLIVPPALETFRFLSGPRIMRCSEDASLSEIEFDAIWGAVTSVFGPARLRIRKCSRWEQGITCDQGCIANFDLVDAQDHGLLVRPFRKSIP